MTSPALREPGGYSLLAQLEGTGALSRLGLHLDDPNLTYDQAEAIGAMLGDMQDCIRFAIGDWLLLIEQLFPEEWSQLAEVLNMSEESRREYMRVAERVPRSRRRKGLKWSHHRAVAALEPAEQKQWLKRAADEGLSHHAMRDALRESGAPPEPPPSPALRTCECCGKPL